MGVENSRKPRVGGLLSEIKKKKIRNKKIMKDERKAVDCDNTIEDMDLGRSFIAFRSTQIRERSKLPREIIGESKKSAVILIS